LPREEDGLGAVRGAEGKARTAGRRRSLLAGRIVRGRHALLGVESGCFTPNLPYQFFVALRLDLPL
jgi:hypothetical protein